MIAKNDYLQKLIDRMNNGMIKVVTGIRRCGKSYLLFDIFYNLNNIDRSSSIVVTILNRLILGFFAIKVLLFHILSKYGFVLLVHMIILKWYELGATIIYSFKQY